MKKGEKQNNENSVDSTCPIESHLFVSETKNITGSMTLVISRVKKGTIKKGSELPA